MFPAIQIGPISLPTSAVLFLTAGYVGLSLSEKRTVLFGIKSNQLYDLVLAAFIGFVTGGRLGYAGLHWNTIAANPMDLLSFDKNIFDLVSGLFSAILVALVFGRRQGLTFWPTLDVLTPFFATMMLALAGSHLANATAFGKETSLPWGIEMRGAVRHPSQIYEIAAAMFILGAIALRKPPVPAGTQFLTFLAWTSGARLFLEAFRGDSLLLFGGIRLGQVLAWMVFALALLGLTKLTADGKKPTETG